MTRTKTAIFLLALMVGSLAATSAFAATKTLFNYPHLYRGTRSMGMGGAYTAVGGDAEGLFYNPATLYNMGFNLNIINPTMEVDQNALDLAEDAQSSMNADTDTERTNKITDLLNNNMGKNIYVRAGVFPSLAVRNFAVGVLGQVEVAGRMHNPLGSSGAMEIDGGAEFGPIAGLSYGFDSIGLRVGLSGKYITRSWINHSFTVAELASDTFDFSTYQKESSDMSFDAGLLYSIPVLESIKPKIGLSVMDITGLDFKDAGEIPMTVNLGVSIAPKVPYLGVVTVAADYQDVTKQYEQDSSTWKRIHLGAEVALLNKHLMLRGGFNQGYGTFGAELDIWAIKLAYTYYAEEMGAYAGQDKDARHMVYFMLGMSWKSDAE